MIETEADCSCERNARGEVGPVADGERLVRPVYHEKRNRYIDPETKMARPGWFRPSEMIEDGISSLRVDLMTAEQRRDQVAAIVATLPKAELFGVFVGRTSDIRQIVNGEAQRSLCVVEDPVKDDPRGAKDNPHHASWIGTPYLKALHTDDPEFLRIQMLLRTAMGTLKVLDEVG